MGKYLIQISNHLTSLGIDMSAFIQRDLEATPITEQAIWNQRVIWMNNDGYLEFQKKLADEAQAEKEEALKVKTDKLAARVKKTEAKEQKAAEKEAKAAAKRKLDEEKGARKRVQ